MRLDDDWDYAKAGVAAIVCGLLVWIPILSTITPSGDVLYFALGRLHTCFTFATIGLICGILALYGSERLLAWTGILLNGSFFVFYFGFYG